MPPKGKAASIGFRRELGLSSLAADLIEALQDSRVVDALGKALAPFISLTVDEGLKKQLEETSDNGLRRAEGGRYVRLIQAVQENTAKENARLQKLADDHNRRLDDIETYSRSDNLIFRGLPEASAAEDRLKCAGPGRWFVNAATIAWFGRSHSDDLLQRGAWDYSAAAGHFDSSSSEGGTEGQGQAGHCTIHESEGARCCVQREEAAEDLT